MPESRIRRKLRSFDVTVGTAVGESTPIRWDEAAGGAFQVGTISTAVVVQVWASSTPDGDYSVLYDASSEAVAVTALGNTATQATYPVPDAAYAAGAIKLVADSTHITTATVSIKT